MTLNAEKIKIKRIDTTLPLPEYKTDGSAAFDLCSREDIIVPAKGWALAPANIIMEVPVGQVLLISARSSLIKHYPGLRLANGIGLVDSDYRGPQDEIKISLHNFSEQDITVRRGDRIAQAILVKVERCGWEEVDNLSNTSRGGFGSTGLR